jgi:hypothetical protein
MRTRLLLGLGVALVALLLLAASFKSLVQVDGYLGVAGGNSGLTAVSKFGANLDVDANEETIYQGEDLVAGSPLRIFTNQAAAYDLYISSSANADATLTIVVEGVDDEWAAASATVTLVAGGGPGTATTAVPSGSTSDQWLRVNRAYNTGSSDLAGIVFLHTSTDAGADGIPDTPASEMITGIAIGENQTLQAAFTVPDGFRGAVTQVCASVLATSGTTTAATMRLRARLVQGQILRTQSVSALTRGATACRNLKPYLSYAARTDLEMTAISTGAANLVISGQFGIVLLPE